MTDAYKVAIDAIRMALVEVAQDDSVDPRYTLIVIGRILHNLDNVLALDNARKNYVDMTSNDSPLEPEPVAYARIYRQMQQAGTVFDATDTEYDRALKEEACSELRAENERLRASRTCLLGGPGRGDCEHFVGWPDVEDETTTDEWGVPNGWCIVCYWRHQALDRDKCR